MFFQGQVAIQILCEQVLMKECLMVAMCISIKSVL